MDVNIKEGKRKKNQLKTVEKEKIDWKCWKFIILYKYSTNTHTHIYIETIYGIVIITVVAINSKL